MSAQDVREKAREVRNLVGGVWEDRNGQETEPVYDPATGEVIAETPLSTKSSRKQMEAFKQMLAEAMSSYTNLMNAPYELYRKNLDAMRKMNE